MKRNFLNRLLNRSRAKSIIKNKQKIIDGFDNNQKKIFELFKKSINEAEFILKDEKFREVRGKKVSIVLYDTPQMLTSTVSVKKNNGVYTDFFFEPKDAQIFKEHFDNYINRRIERHRNKKTQDVSDYLDDLIYGDN